MNYSLTHENLLDYIGKAEKALQVLAFMVRLTPGSTDDKFVASLQAGLAFVKAHLDDEWAGMALAVLNQVLQVKGVAALLDRLKVTV